MKKNMPKRNSRVDQKSAEIKLKATLPAGPFHWIRTQEFGFHMTSPKIQTRKLSILLSF